MNLTALYHRERRRQRLQLLLMLKELTEGGFLVQDYFGSGSGDVMNGGTTLLPKEWLQKNGRKISV